MDIQCITKNQRRHPAADATSVPCVGWGHPTPPLFAPLFPAHARFRVGADALIGPLRHCRFRVRNSRRDVGIAPNAKTNLRRTNDAHIRRAGCPHPAAISHQIPFNARPRAAVATENRNVRGRSGCCMQMLRRSGRRRTAGARWRFSGSSSRSRERPRPRNRQNRGRRPAPFCATPG